MTNNEPDFIEFGSMEEMVAWVADQRAEVYARELTAEQQAIRYGDYAVRFMDNMVVFAYVEPPVGEIPEVVEHIEAKDREENMLFCKVFSTVETEGEYGWLHRSVLWPIPQVHFDIAGGSGWDFEKLPENTKYLVESAYYSIRSTV